jgi:hypothetical protein
MTKKQNPLAPDEQRKRFEAEVRNQSEVGDFDHDAAEAALEALLRKNGNSPLRRVSANRTR